MLWRDKWRSWKVESKTIYNAQPASILESSKDFEECTADNDEKQSNHCIASAANALLILQFALLAHETTFLHILGKLFVTLLQGPFSLQRKREMAELRLRLRHKRKAFSFVFFSLRRTARRAPGHTAASLGASFGVG